MNNKVCLSIFLLEIVCGLEVCIMASMIIILLRTLIFPPDRRVRPPHTVRNCWKRYFFTFIPAVSCRINVGTCRKTQKTPEETVRKTYIICATPAQKCRTNIPFHKRMVERLFHKTTPLSLKRIL
jgi:hypothetical protein